MDRDADFAAFVSSRWGALVRSAQLLGCSPTDAEDSVQTALIRCYRSWDKVGRASTVDAYVYRVLVNCLHSERKRRWSGEIPTADLPDSRHGSDDLAEQAASRTTMQEALTHLSSHHRTVLVLRFFSDLSERQTAQVLGVPPGTVKSRVSRALAALNEYVESAVQADKEPM